MKILGIESTCDETGVAVVKDGRWILSNVVASSVDLQKKYGGVVPEVAAREQVRSILPVIAEAIANAAKTRNSKLETRNNLLNPQTTKWAKENIDAIAVAHGPGLIGSLLIGVETAKTLALVWDKPLIPVNHLIGHIYANWLTPTVNGQSLMVDRDKRKPNERLTMNDEPEFPLIALIVSGGHTDLLLMTGHGKYQWLGGTRDDAAGEAFDKVARVLGLSYPGGPEVERLASQTRNKKHGTRNFKLPRPMVDSNDFDFSFSGLKTAVINKVSQLSDVKGQMSVIAYEFQEAVVDVLVTKTVRAAKKFKAKSIAVGGGVAANNRLRSQFAIHSSQIRIPVHFPTKGMSVDNGAMIAAAAFYNFKPVKINNLSADSSLYFLKS